MKRTQRLFIVASLIGAMTLQVPTYAVVPNGSELSKNPDKNIFKVYDTKISVDKQLDLNKLLQKDLSIKVNTKEPQILIIHSHPQEKYSGDKQGSVIDVGNELERILEENYKVSVLHYKDEKNIESVNGSTIGAYERIEPVVKEILKKNPSIQVVIDIHRDGGLEPTAQLINKEPTAQITILNGLSIDEKVGKIGSSKEYANPYIEDNLAFSVQMKEMSDKLVPELMRPIVLAPFRYSLHMAPKSILVNIGNNEDSLEAALNAVEPFEESLAGVLGLEKTETNK